MTSEASDEARAFVEDLLRHLGEGGTGGQRRLECVELCPICRTADVIRATAPPELREQWQAVQREALLTMRALVDHYLERLEQRESTRGPSVEDIPVE